MSNSDMKNAGIDRILGLVFFVFLIALWEVLSVMADNKFMLPGPLDVVKSLWENRKPIFTVHLPATMKVVAIGGVLSIILGAALAVLMDASKRVEKAVYPLLTITQTVPVMCIAPVLVLWLGYSVQMRILVVILANFFSVTVNLFDGLRSTSGELTELMDTYGASKGQKYIMLRLPSSLPYFFSALRVAVPWAVVSAAVSEWLGAEYGLGTYSRYLLTSFDAAGVIAPLVVLTAVALVLNGILKFAENKIVRW